MKKNIFSSAEQGFSLLELMIVLILMSILTTIAVMGLTSNKLFAADNQALLITDILQEARQKALTQRKTLRVELNETKQQIRLIDENNTNIADDDRVIRTSPFDKTTTVGVKPANVDSVRSILPQSNSPVPEIQYKKTTYPLSANEMVKTLRFTKSGEVIDGGTDNLGTGAINSGTTIYVYNGAPGSSSNVIRAITLSGVTAASQLFKCNPDKTGICASWTK